MAPKHPPSPPMTLRNMRELGVQRADRVLPQRCLPSHGADRRVELSGRDRGAVVPPSHEVRQVRGWKHRRAPELKEQPPQESLIGKVWR
jgi:hypothetical protein